MIERAPSRESYEPGRADARIVLSNKALFLLQQDIGTRTVEGLEHIASLEEPPVIAVSHSTGYDFPLAISSMGNSINFAIADQSTHHQMGKEFSAYLWYQLCGRGNAYPVSYSWVNGQKKADPFNPEDAEPMAQTMQQGRAMMVAAHSPLKVDAHGNAVPPRPGYLAAYLAGKTQAPILPVGVSYERREGSKKYDATLRVGEPFELKGEADTATIRDLRALQLHDLLDESENYVLELELTRLRADGRKVLSVVQSLQDLEHGYPVIDNAYAREGS